MNISPNSPMIIWRLTDGKPGHESQTAGLIKALQRKLNCKVIDIKVKGRLQPLVSLISSHWPQGAGLPLPDLIIGAGHRTHLHMLAAKRAYGGRTIVMMQPSLPVHLFDLCILPEHDQYQGSGKVLETRGVLNIINAKGEHHEDKALIMVGGPSKHFNWNEQSLLAQISQITRQNPEIDFTLTTSRRTPAEFTAQVKQIKSTNLIVIPVEETQPGWVAQQLADSAYAWISEDSVSMVYEALTAQVAVGLLNMQMRKANRISYGMNQLVSHNLLCRFDSLGHYKNKLRPAIGFMEAERCSNWLLHNWLLPDQSVNTVLVPQTNT